MGASWPERVSRGGLLYVSAMCVLNRGSWIDRDTLVKHLIVSSWEGPAVPVMSSRGLQPAAACVS